MQPAVHQHIHLHGMATWPAGLIAPQQGRAHAIYCAACGGTTGEGKPYCVEHVVANPHSSRVIAEIDRRAREAVALGAGRGKIAPGSTLLADAAVVLAERSSITARKLALQLEIPIRAADAYLRRLWRDRLAWLVRSPRGVLVAVDPRAPCDELPEWARAGRHGCRKPLAVGG